jgi:ATP synthase protein I
MMTTERPAAPSLRVPGVRAALAVTVLGGLAAVAVAGLVAGQAQMVGALLGAALVCGFFVFGALSTNVAAAYLPQASLVVAMLTYVLQVVGLWVVLLAVTRSGLTDESIDSRWLAGTVIVGTLVWVATLCVNALTGAEARK